MRLITVQGQPVPRDLLNYVNGVVLRSTILIDEKERMEHVRNSLRSMFQGRKIANAWWEVHELANGSLAVVLPRVCNNLVVLMIEPGQPPLTPADMEAAQAVIERPEYWCRAKLFRALQAAKQKGVLGEVLDEMEVPEAEQARIEDHLDKHWRAS